MNSLKTHRILILSVAMALVATVSSVAIFADDNVTPLGKIPEVGEAVDVDNNAETNPDRPSLKQLCLDHLPIVCCEPTAYNGSEACVTELQGVFAKMDAEKKKDEQKKAKLEKQLNIIIEKGQKMRETGVACERACGGTAEEHNACLEVCDRTYPEYLKLGEKAQKLQADIEELDAKIKKAASDLKEIQAKTGIKAKKSTVKKPIKKKTRIFRPVEGANRQSTPGTK